MSDAPGCSKCRYSKRGCARCRDPAFKERQRVKAAGKVQPKKPGLPISRARKRSAEAPREDVKPTIAKRPRKSKHTRYQAEEGLQSCAQAPGAKRQHKQTTQASYAVAPEPDVTQNRHSDHKASSSCQAHAVGHTDAPLQRSTDQSRDTCTDGGDMPAKEATNVASGLELGLMAGLLPLQQEPGSAVPDDQAVEAGPRLAEIFMAGLPLKATDLQTNSRSTASPSRAYHNRAKTSARQALVRNTTLHPFIFLVQVLCFAAMGILPGYHGSPFAIFFTSSTAVS